MLNPFQTSLEKSYRVATRWQLLIAGDRAVIHLLEAHAVFEKLYIKCIFLNSVLCGLKGLTFSSPKWRQSWTFQNDTSSLTNVILCNSQDFHCDDSCRRIAVSLWARPNRHRARVVGSQVSHVSKLLSVLMPYSWCTNANPYKQKLSPCYWGPSKNLWVMFIIPPWLTYYPT